MAGIDPAAVPAFKDWMPRDEPPVLEDAHFGGVALHLQHPLPGGVRHRVVVSADGDHAVAADAPLDGQDRVAGVRGQRDQRGLLLRESLVDDPAGGGMDAPVGDLAAPLVELGVQVVQAPEGPAQEEVLADVAERALDLALGLRPVGSAGPRCQCRSKIPQKCRSKIPQFLCVSGAIRFSRCGSPFWAGLVFSAGAAA